jgi:uracil-DNA glycosylase
MVVGCIAKVKQPALTAVCRSRSHPALPAGGGGLFIDRVAALDPGRGAPVDVGHRGVPELLQVACGCEAALAAMADGQDGPIAGHFVDTLLQLPQRDQLRARDVTLLVLPWLSDIEEEGRRLGRQSLAQLGDVDNGDRSHREILVAGAQASPVTRRRFHSVSKGQQYLQFFGSDALKRLHGCAIAEADRGADSPCAGLAEPLRRPQIGFGNPHAPIVFLSPSPLDAASASNEAFSEWLDHEAGLEHHMTSDTPQPYYRYVRAVLLSARRRLGQKPEKHDGMNLAFHTWAVRCPTANPDLVTDDATNQCVDRHLQSLLETINPQLVVAMGGPVARQLWWRTMQTWDGWGRMTTLHGRVLDVQLGNRTVPAILSVHPFQRGVELHPEVIGRAIGDRLRPEQFAPQELKAA